MNEEKKNILIKIYNSYWTIEILSDRSQGGWRLKALIRQDENTLTSLDDIYSRKNHTDLKVRVTCTSF